MRSQKLFDEIYARMQLRDTQELLTLWKENNRALWSDQAFEAMKTILTERGAAVPSQSEAKCDAPVLGPTDRIVETLRGAGRWALSFLMTNTSTTPSAPPAYDRLGGWLYLWVLTATTITYELLQGLIMVSPPVAADMWARANDPLASGAHWLLKPFLLFELCSRAALLYTGGVVARASFKRRSYVPGLTIGFLGAYLIVLVIEEVMSFVMVKSNEEFLIEPAWTTLGSMEFFLVLVSCLVWIPYFHRSERVKATFVKTG